LKTQRATAVLVGAGMVAKTHVDACMDAREMVHLKGVVSRRRASAEALVAATGAPLEVYESLADVAADASVDFAIVVTPPDARAEVIAPLAAAGKHILLEKPVGRTAAEARAVVALCAEADVQLGVVFQHRMRAASLAARDLVASGRTYGAQAETGGGADPMAFTHAWHQEIITDFAKAIRAGRAPMVTGAQALVAHDFIDAVTAAC